MSANLRENDSPELNIGDGDDDNDNNGEGDEDHAGDGYHGVQMIDRAKS